MCYGCWEEEGKPSINNLEVGTLALLIQKSNPFGALHIFVEDWNCEDSDIEFCLNDEDADEQDKATCEIALLMSYEERVSALALASNFWGAQSKFDREDRSGTA